MWSLTDAAFCPTRQVHRRGIHAPFVPSHSATQRSERLLPSHQQSEPRVSAGQVRGRRHGEGAEGKGACGLVVAAGRAGAAGHLCPAVLTMDPSVSRACWGSGEGRQEARGGPRAPQTCPRLLKCSDEARCTIPAERDSRLPSGVWASSPHMCSPHASPTVRGWRQPHVRPCFHACDFIRAVNQPCELSSLLYGRGSEAPRGVEGQEPGALTHAGMCP